MPHTSCTHLCFRVLIREVKAKRQSVLLPLLDPDERELQLWAVVRDAQLHVIAV